ncbi:hypothetical protein C8R46DRAFT_1341808 [Mycena filopes]|nr:hypothetical protein C8R46DRAFT_1341808 [Mycena filopes]
MTTRTSTTKDCDSNTHKHFFLLLPRWPTIYPAFAHPQPPFLRGPHTSSLGCRVLGLSLASPRRPHQHHGSCTNSRQTTKSTSAPRIPLPMTSSVRPVVRYRPQSAFLVSHAAISAAVVSRLLARRLITRPGEVSPIIEAERQSFLAMYLLLNHRHARARTPEQAAGYAQMEAWMAREDATPELVYGQQNPQGSQNLIAAWNAVTEAIIPALERLS